MRRKRSRDPVAVTGIGVICPLGTTREEVWEGVVEGRCGITEIDSVDISALSFRYGGQVRGLDVERCPAWLRGAWIDRASQMVVTAADEALTQAAVDLAAVDRRRVGITLGSCQPRIDRARPFYSTADVAGYAVADPAPLLGCSMSTPADALAAHLRIRGPKHIISNACAAGGNAVGLAFDVLCDDRADVMLAGGVDLLESYGLGGFDSIQAVDARPTAPYSRSGGINLGEGAAVLVLESAAHARRRGAVALAWVMGYALSSDAHHATAPDPTGGGAMRAMRRALAQAGLNAADVDYVNGHGTGTPANDSAERAAMRTFFAARSTAVPISSTKSQIGHTLGAAGAIEAAVCVQALQHQVLPPTIHVESPHDDADFDIVPNRGRDGDVGTVLSTSFAFGGANCAVALSRTPRAVPSCDEDRVVITGHGIVSPFGCGADFLAALRDGRAGFAQVERLRSAGLQCALAGDVTDRTHLRHIDPGYVRKLDQLGRLTVAASRMAMEHARLRLSPGARERAGLIFATFTGPAETMGSLRATVSREGLGRINARSFPNTVMNAAAGHASLSLQLKGPTTTLVTGFVAGLSGIGYAADLVRRGEADVMLAVSADELTLEVVAAFERLGMLTPCAPRPYDHAARGFVPAAAGCALTLETLSHARDRGATVLGEVLGHAVSADGHAMAGSDPTGRAWRECAEAALDDAGVEPRDVAVVFGEGRANPVIDAAELCALNAVFDGVDVRLATLSGSCGHTASTQGPLGVVAALDALAGGEVAGIAGLHAPIPEMGSLRWHGAVAAERRAALVTCAAPGGTYATVVVGAPPP